MPEASIVEFEPTVLNVVNDDDWQKLLDRYPAEVPRPFQRVLEVARQNGAVCVIIEHHHDDMDYRSEYRSFRSGLHAPPPYLTDRLHFFSEPVHDPVLELPAEKFLGSVVLRPAGTGLVGTTLMKPPPDWSEFHIASVRCTIELFGHSLHVDAVPFAQQDAQFARCAHVAAWVCHRTSALRGELPVRPLAEFPTMSASNLGPSNSSGLTIDELSELLTKVGLLSGIHVMGAMPSTNTETAIPLAQQKRPPAKWDSRAAWVACRRLSGGYPVIVGVSGHAFVLIGFESANRPVSPKTRFGRHDDLRGPYLTVDNILSDTESLSGDRFDWDVLLTPLPSDLWLSAEAAEIAGRTALKLRSFDTANELRSADSEGRIAWRTIPISSRILKDTVALRGLELAEQRVYRKLPLPEKVWVVEALDIDQMKGRGNSVVAEAILDPQSSDFNPISFARRSYGNVSIGDAEAQPTNTKLTRSLMEFIPA
jgi:hypothetical protein